MITKIVIWGAIALFTLLSLGIIFQFIMTKIDKWRFPPLGQFIIVYQKKLHAIISKNLKKGPTIVFEEEEAELPQRGFLYKKKLKNLLIVSAMIAWALG